MQKNNILLMVDYIPISQYEFQCTKEVAQKYSIPTRLLLSVRITEGGKVGKKNKNKNGTFDYGVMQINTIWTNKFEKLFGITSTQIMNDFCLSMHSAGYILRYEINSAKGDFWRGVGHYHSHTPILRDAYIKRVYKNSLTF